uniref:hypothetical protein n=1 Tax=Parerythrobacter lutipelagi TaxID=1964208 RepID=UPI0010F7C53B|nr:hypothetical protein [Parerythrobacter lutipelagi]
MRLLIASVAALALASGGAYAQPGKGNGNGNGNGNSKAAATKSQGGPKANRGNAGADKRGGPPAMKQRGNDRGAPAVRSNGNRGAGNAPAARGNDRKAFRDNGPSAKRDNGKGNSRKNDRGGRDLDVRFVDRGDSFGIFRDYDRRVASYQGCPPGLAKKYNGCMPPGLAKKQPNYRPSFFGFDGLGDRRFHYDDGFLLRLGRDGRISASIPLLGGALAAGNLWPDYYRPVEVRPYYANYYGLQPNGYRYANNVLYRVDPETAAITSVAALLTGDDFAVGQPAPTGYDVYNVPYRYRDQYRDGPDANYRYSDGYVYRLDPETRLVAAAIELALD